ncbi:pilus assembly protein FimV [Pseudomonas sp. NFACC02]|uniref:FimV/HubP family polar landmark protein n=1 Tax=Pseudomonas sp. NFACC02 TaxID=1566250 RepID=UPI0008B51A3F|nr:FimV/HubP family polar landmark protein [Pseudomonas sp. NFACC02]SEQ63869.1 pilus assembly protein FimV [Pseudomonas sp. NFACC02]
MVQVRKLVLAIAAASALSSGTAQALGLGGLTVKSTLNQPLVAEIELTQVQDLNAAQVVPSLATSAEFAQAGVGRTPILDDLTFTPVVNPGGKSVLRITSTKPVRDPYVKFLVQVLWPNGRVLREYSLLLDPPKLSPQAPAAAAQLPSIAPGTAPAQAPTAQAPVEAPAQPPAAPASPKYSEYTTANNDTLWEIAERVRNGGTVQQTMLAIQALNPDAFIAGNINRLKKGQVLRLPSPQEVSATPQPRAIAEVAEQNRAWREGRRMPTGARQVDATRRDRTDATPAQIEAKDNLSLVAANAKPGAKGAAGDAAELSNKLAVTQESLDSTRRDNAELKSRMSDLQSQVDKLNRLIQLKNDQLAKMQAAGAAVPPPAADANSTVSPNSVTNPNNAANPAMPAQIVPPPAAPDAAGKPPNEIAPEDALPVEGATVTGATPDQPSVAPQTPAATDADNQSALDKILASPMLMGLIGGGALLVLLLLLLLLARRRNALIEAEKHRQMARALSEESDFASDLDMPESSFEGLEVPPPNVKMAPLAAVIVEPTRERPADVLVQAEIHIAYGRVNQAVALLEEAIKEEPLRSDLRLKLMEIYAEQNNQAGFVAQERQLIATGKNHAEVEQLKTRYPAMAAAAAAAAGVAAAAALAAEMDAKYVEDLLSDKDEPAPVVDTDPAPQPVAQTSDDFDTAFDLSLDDLEPTSPAAAKDQSEHVADSTHDDLDLDAPFGGSTADDLDFDSILREQTEAKNAEPADLADFDLDLSEDQPGLKAEDDYLLGREDDLHGLPAFDETADLGASKPASEDDLELPADFDLSLADEMESEQASQAFASEIDDVNAELERLSQSLEQPAIAKPFDNTPTFTEDDALLADDEPEFDFLSGTDEAATKLDLARAYIEMGDADGARDILDEVVAEGDDGQKTEAREMLSRLA